MSGWSFTPALPLRDCKAGRGVKLLASILGLIITSVPLHWIIFNPSFSSLLHNHSLPDVPIQIHADPRLTIREDFIFNVRMHRYCIRAGCQD